MELNEKYKQWDEVFWKYFLVPSSNPLVENGTNIPFAVVNIKNGLGNTGDGTINIANLLTYLWISGKNNTIHPIDIDDCLDTLIRLEVGAFLYYKNAFPYLFQTEDEFQEGFFIRDDIDKSKASWGSYRMLQTLSNEDPCHSPFTSQDQVWNLNPILSYIMTDETIKEGVREKAREIGYGMNDYIYRNGYTIYNPYLSYINHMVGYLPSFNLGMDERRNDRKEHFKPNIKVKRGANNWYYSGGTKACRDAFYNGCKDYSHSLRTFLYRGIIAFLDKVYEPIYRMFTKKDFKHNSYYCYGATSGIWYSKNFEKTVLKKFNKSLKGAEGKREELFQPINVPYVLYKNKEVDLEGLKSYLEKYPAFDENAENVDSPIEALILYEYYKSFGN